ncbi:MAG: Hsp33 family molecular chaperone HslO, partial [Bdellovibrionales bacterium]|nr:Hsp33 family molecular chaperone HslO [Bdellovibrionales bacterium]
MERVHRFVSNDFTLRASAVNATEVVKEMQKIQDTSPLPTMAVGRAMVGALLLASHLKENQQVGIYVRGDGPMGRVYAEASFEGHVRGYTPHTYFEPEKYQTGLHLKEYIGKGTLSVTRHMPFQKQPHHGTVELVSSEIGQDISHYLIQSHQIRSVISLGVYLDT